MAKSKFYTDKMHEHCKAFNIENMAPLIQKFYSEYSPKFPAKYMSSSLADNRLNLFEFIEKSLEQGINSDYKVHLDYDLIDYRLNYINSEKINEEIESKSYLDSKYVWYWFRPTTIPTNIRELVVDKFELLEEFYVNSIESHVKSFLMRGHVREIWINVDKLYKNGINKYVNQFNRFSIISPNELDKSIVKYTESGIYGLLDNADLYSEYKDKAGVINEIQLLKFLYKNSPTNEPVVINDFAKSLLLNPLEFLPDKTLLDKYIEENNAPINSLRERLGLPKIGEGWISETKLFYQLKEEFINNTVLQHYKPKWLGRQHFDIYFPYRNIAVEYQGKQHFESVEFFGGDEALSKNIKRDKRKKEKSELNNCDLIYVESGYDFNELCKRIRESKNYVG